jgi:predicted permease
MAVFLAEWSVALFLCIKRSKQKLNTALLMVGVPLLTALVAAVVYYLVNLKQEPERIACLGGLTGWSLGTLVSILVGVIHSRRSRARFRFQHDCLRKTGDEDASYTIDSVECQSRPRSWFIRR